MSARGCSAPNLNAACRLEGTTTRRGKKHRKAQKLDFWECTWLKSKSPAWNQEEKRLPSTQGFQQQSA